MYVFDGEMQFIPRGTPHAWQNVGDGPAQMLAVGAIVGLVVIAMYLPLFTIYELVQ